MKIKILIGILVFLIIVNLAAIGSYVFIHFTKGRGDWPDVGPPPGDDRTPRWSLPHPGLKLSDEQRQQLGGLLRDWREETRDLHEQIDRLEEEAFELMQREPVPMEEVRDKLKEITDLRFEISQKAIEKMVKAKRFLSPEQQKIFFNAIIKARPKKWEYRSYFREGETPGRKRKPNFHKQFYY